MDDRRRAVSERDHLAGAARLEARRHEEPVRAGIEAPRQVAVEAFHQRDAAPTRRPRSRASSVARPRRGCPSRGRRGARRGRAAPGSPRRACRSPSGDPAARPSREPAAVGRIQADLLEQRRPTRRLAGPVRARVRAASAGSVAGSHSSVSSPLRIPKKRSPRARNTASRPMPMSGWSASCGESRAHRLTSSAPSMPARSRSIPSAPPIGPSPSSGTCVRRRPAVVREVVDREHEGGPHDGRILAERAIPLEQRGHGMPVVDVDDVGRTFGRPQVVERGSARAARIATRCPGGPRTPCRRSRRGRRLRDGRRDAAGSRASPRSGCGGRSCAR